MRGIFVDKLVHFQITTSSEITCQDWTNVVKRELSSSNFVLKSYYNKLGNITQRNIQTTNGAILCK